MKQLKHIPYVLAFAFIFVVITINHDYIHEALSYQPEITFAQLIATIIAAIGIILLAFVDWERFDNEKVNKR